MLEWFKNAGTSLVNLFSGPRRSDDDERDYAPSPYGREKVKTAPKNVPAFLPWFDENQSLGETPEMRRAYRLMLADPNIKAAILSKLFGVMALDLTVSPSRKKDARDGAIADFVRWNLADAMQEGMAGLIWDILSGALIDGISICEPVWELEDEGKYRGKRYLRRLKALDVGNAVVPIIDEHRNIVAIRGLQYNAGEEWDPDEFVITQHLGLFENPLGMSDLRAAYGRWWILDSATKLRAMGAERRAFGIVSAEYPDVTKQASLEEALSNLRYRHWMAVPEGTKLQVLDLAGQSSSYFSEQRKDLQEEIFLAINGAILQATTSGAGQNRGASAVHKDTADLRAWHLRTMVTHVLNDHKRGLIRRIVDKNFLAVEGYPKASLGGVDEAELKESLAIDKDLKQAFGWKFNREELEERYGRKWEDDPEKALPDAPPPGMPGMGGMPGPDGGQPAMPQGPQAGGDLPPPIVPSSKPDAAFSEEPEDGDDLAALYVDLLNALEESGESYDDTLDAASDELDSMGWTLDQDANGVWSAKRYGGSVAKFAEGDWTKQQGPRGGTYWVSKANPNRKVYRKDNPGSTREDKAQRRKDRGSVDVDALRKRLTAHAGEQTKVEAKRTNAAYRTLKRHHGELTVHRLEELADTLQKALDGLPEGREGLMGEHLRRQLRGVGAMLDAANKDGVSGVVEGGAKKGEKEAEAPKAEAPSEAKAKEPWEMTREDAAMKAYLEAKGIPVNDDGTVTLFHSSQYAEKIEGDGLIKATTGKNTLGHKVEDAAWTTPHKKDLERWNGGGENGTVEVRVPVRFLRHTPNTDEFYFEGGLKRQPNGNWEPTKKPKDTFVNKLAMRDYSDDHRAAIVSALAAGKPVPPEVLADYPDLAAKSAGPQYGDKNADGAEGAEKKPWEQTREEFKKSAAPTMPEKAAEGGKVEGRDYLDGEKRPEPPEGKEWVSSIEQQFGGPDGPNGNREFRKVWRLKATKEQAQKDMDQWFATAPSLDTVDNLEHGSGESGDRVVVSGDRATIIRSYPLKPLHVVRRNGKWHLIGTGDPDDRKDFKGVLSAYNQDVLDGESGKTASWRNAIRQKKWSAFQYAPDDLFQQFPGLAKEFPDVAKSFAGLGKQKFANQGPN
jgi:hypothetical protein